MISTIIGGGIVGLPFCFFYAGVIMALSLNIVIAFLTVYSCFLLVRVKSMSGGYVEFSEVGYLLLGRASIFIVNLLVFINSFGLIIVYFIVFSGIAESLMIYITE